jgi:hypothetical protein
VFGVFVDVEDHVDGVIAMTHAPPGATVNAQRESPAILFLASSAVAGPVTRWAAETGFRSVFAAASGCEPHRSGVLIAEGWEMQADGSSRTLLGPTALRPQAVAVLDHSPDVLATARQSALSCSARWAHHDLDAGLGPQVTRPRSGLAGAEGPGSGPKAAGVVHGLLQFASGAIPLRLLDVRLPPSARRGADDPERLRHAQVLIESALEARVQDWTYTMSPLLHRVLAPCVVLVDADGNCTFTDPLRDQCAGTGEGEPLIRRWLRQVLAGTQAPRPVVIPSRARLTSRDPAAPEARGQRTPLATVVDPEAFPRLFGTPQQIDTAHVPAASFSHLDGRLRARGADNGSAQAETLHQRICRVRATAAAPGALEPRFVEPGVGRACLVADIYLSARDAFHDFTVLGVGLTPFSDGGYVEIGRKIDGKASLVRADHRRVCSERLEAAGCQTGRVVAIAALPGEDIEMPDGTMSPSALVVRGFRCAYRVKQLDPLICCLHSIQHTPLVGAFLAEQAQRLRRHTGAPAGTLEDDDLLADVIERQSPAQDALRALLRMNSADAAGGWASLVHAARIAAIDAWAPQLLGPVGARLALELQLDHDVTTEEYLRWFARCVGSQLATWRRLRFLHDYHQPGVGRWHPGHLYTLGENNVTLLAEFPDLDTGVFVDDDEEYLAQAIQLASGDVTVLRHGFSHFHARDVAAAETVVRTLALLTCRHDPGMVTTAVQDYRAAYAAAEAAR